jgi:hypothetical protein
VIAIPVERQGGRSLQKIAEVFVNFLYSTLCGHLAQAVWLRHTLHEGNVIGAGDAAVLHASILRVLPVFSACSPPRFVWF